MYPNDPDFYRQCHRERVAQLRADYQRAPARHRRNPFARLVPCAQSVFSRVHSRRRAPARA